MGPSMTFAKMLTRIVPVLAVAAALAGCGINTIPTRDEAVKAKWGEVQNQYQRRADLVPQLVATVKGAAAQEKSVLIAVTEARASAGRVQVDASTTTDPAKFGQYQASQDRLSGALFAVRQLQEAYPDLKTNQNFLTLQDQLEGTENRITNARRDYNEAVQSYNTALRTWPTQIWKGDAKPALPFTAAPSSQVAPTVSFDTTPPPAPAGTTPVAPK
ncbi:MAG: LemA family protein [Caulobacter sp.]|jgi:LemA protein|nr:LemA family protein [Caulobacter sp.]